MHRSFALAAGFAGFAFAAELMPAAQQTALVQKYCAVCHTDAAKNGGLSLQHYDAAQANPPLAAMLLAKLRTGAMGAAGLGIPDQGTQDAWVATTAAQAERAGRWSVHTEAPVLTASIVRTVEPRKGDRDASAYRLTLVCNGVTHKGEIQLTWAPSPQTGRTFMVSGDGSPGIPQRLEGTETMGNGTSGSSGRAGAMLNTPLPRQTLTVTNVFPGEKVVFPVGELGKGDRLQFAACFPGRADQ